MVLVATRRDAGVSTRRKRSRRSLIWVVLGVVVLLYPMVATIYNDYKIHQQAATYGKSVARIDPPEQLEHYRFQAHAYNSWLTQQGHHARPALPSDPGFDRYMETLNPPETFGVMARIRIPSIGVDLPVRHTTNSSVLYEGAGHMYGSSLPVGGMGTNAVISAHTGMVDASMFDNLPRIKDGALIRIDVLGSSLYYQVVSRQVVAPSDYSAVEYFHDRDLLTLITCTPYGINTDRLLVLAERVDPAPVGADSETTVWFRWSWWMIADAAIIICVVLGVTGWELRLAWRRRKAKTEVGGER